MNIVWKRSLGVLGRPPAFTWQTAEGDARHRRLCQADENNQARRHRPWGSSISEFAIPNADVAQGSCSRANNLGISVIS
jgi:hypothetical protein